MAESGAWVQDFTHIWFMGMWIYVATRERTGSLRRCAHIWFMGMWIYVATVPDLKTRRILGWSMGLRHDKDLVHRAVLDALSKYRPPAILHSDWGSEYLSYKLRDLCDKLEIELSCSDKASPWQNGFRERFYSTLKDELGPIGRFKNLSELYEGIALEPTHQPGHGSP